MCNHFWRTKDTVGVIISIGSFTFSVQTTSKYQVIILPSVKSLSNFWAGSVNISKMPSATTHATNSL